MKNIKVHGDGCTDCKIIRHIRDEAIQKPVAALPRPALSPVAEPEYL